MPDTKIKTQLVEGDAAMGACYKCVHRRTIPGNAHSRCAPFADAMVKAEPAFELMSYLSRGAAPIGLTANGEDITRFNEAGIQGGWASWPFNFDPVWLERCMAFTPKEV